MVAARPRILIVEDAPAIARDLAQRLGRLGYEVAGVTGSGARAMALARAERPDLVLADIRLDDDVDGIAVAEYAHDELAIPTVFLTGQPDDALRAARRTESFGYIIKPFHDRELQVVIEVALYKHAAERDRSERELLARRRDKLVSLGQLAGGVVHDFNNVLTVILSNTRALEAELGWSDTARRKLGLIQAAAERAARLTQQWLTLGREPAAADAADLGAVVASSAAMLEDLLGPAVALRWEVEPQLPPVAASASELEQVLLNLVVNARDAMPDGGAVALAVRRVTRDGAPWVALTVADDGEGMDDATRCQIFEPFFTTKVAGKGSGWGLATVRAIVERARGTVAVDSAPGRGTLFTIELPAATPAQPSDAEDGAAMGGTVVLAAPHADAREAIRDTLQAAGLDVIEARDGREALAACTSFRDRVELVIAAAAMPGLDGPALARQLAVQLPATKIVYLTGALDPPTPGVALRAPYRPADVLAVVSRALRAARTPGPPASSPIAADDAAVSPPRATGTG